MGKCNKTHCMGKAWEIDTHTFSIVWVHFAHLIPIRWYNSAYGKCMGFPVNLPQYGPTVSSRTLWKQAPMCVLNSGAVLKAVENLLRCTSAEAQLDLFLKEFQLLYS